MKQFALISGAIFGILSIIFGAFGAHALKKILSQERLDSFEVAVRYQMYAALALLWMGIGLNPGSSNTSWAVGLLFSGTILFSGSIYLLSFKDKLQMNFRFIGPITPLGGLLMILAWLFALLEIIS